MSCARHRLLALLILVGGMAACNRSTPPQPPPEEVLRAAALAQQQLESARMVTDGTFSMEGGLGRMAEGTFRVDTLLAGGGRQSESAIQLQWTGGVEPASILAKGRAVFADGSTYVRLDQLTIDPPDPAWDPEILGASLGAWWLLPGGTGATASVTPHPNVLRAQTEAVRVTRNRGIAAINGRPAYHYDVQLDAEAFLSYMRALAEDRGEPFDAQAANAIVSALRGTGELWIDTETHWIHRIRWALDPILLPNGAALTLTGDIAVREHNAAPRVTVPMHAEALPARFPPIVP